MWTKLRAKTVTKAAECKFIKFFLLAIAQSNSPLFVGGFQWNKTTMMLKIKKKKNRIKCLSDRN